MARCTGSQLTLFLMRAIRYDIELRHQKTLKKPVSAHYSGWKCLEFECLYRYHKYLKLRILTLFRQFAILWLKNHAWLSLRRCLKISNRNCGWLNLYMKGIGWKFWHSFRCPRRIKLSRSPYLKLGIAILIRYLFNIPFLARNLP